MMQGKVAKTAFTGKRSCFISIPYEWTTSLPRNKLLVLELQWDTGCLYTSWQGEVTSDALGDSTAVVELNGLFASKHGLKDGKEVAVIPVTQVDNCVKILVEPVTPDDWEILELHAAFIEGHLMDQVRVVWSGEVLPIWVHKSTCIFVRIGQIEPNQNCVLLVPDSEVVVSPNVRTGSSVHSEKPTSSDQSALGKLGQKSLSRFLSEEELNSVGTDLTLDDEVDSCIFDEYEEKRPKDVIFKVFGKVLGTAQKIWWGMEDFNTIQASPKNVKVTYQPESEILQLTFDHALRVHYLPDVAEKPRKYKGHPGVYISNQPSVVYISLQTFLELVYKQNEPGSYKITMPCSFLAAIKHLPSPKQQEEVIKASMNKATKSEKTDKEENAQCIVRVVVLDENWSHSVRNEKRERLCKVNLKPYSVMTGHVAVHDLLRRQLRLDVTGRVRLKALSQHKQAAIHSIVINPLSTMPGGMTADLLRMAFHAWLATSTASCFPLVTASGTLLKFFITQDHFAEFLISLTPKKKSVTVKALDYFLISETTLKEVKVKYDLVKVTELSLPPSVLRLPHFDLKSVDPEVPSADIDKLGGVNAILDELLDHLTSCLPITPLTTVFMSSTPGVSGGGSVLICGPRGVGKSTIARAVCRKLATYPTLAHIDVVDCKPLRGKNPDSFKRYLEKITLELSWRQPGVLLLDDLDQIAAAPSGPEQEASGEMQYFIKMAEILKDIFLAEIQDKSNIVVIATAKSDTSVCDVLLPTRGHHFFSKVIQIKAPNKTERQTMMKCMIENRLGVNPDCVNELDLEKVASRSEGYVARDLELVISRAVHAHKMMQQATLTEVFLRDEDMAVAMDGFTPAALRGVSLHKPGELGWDDVGGLLHVRNTLIETLQWPSMYPQLFSSCPLRLRSGILLYGAPGTGKTLLAGILAKECGLNFISIKGPELLNKYIGASEQAVRDTFARAQSAKPCILFFDEFDSLAPRRGHDSTGVTDRVVNQFLTQLDGVEGLDGVYVLGATSRPDLIDPALLRPGRLDKAVFCPLPDKDDRVQILKALTRNIALAEDADLETLSKSCSNFSGADLKALLYNAQLEAIHEQTAMMHRSSISRESSPAQGDVLRSYEVVPRKPLDQELTEAESANASEKIVQTTERSLSIDETHFSEAPEDGSSCKPPGGSLKVIQKSRDKVIYMPRLEDGQVDLDTQESEDLHKQISSLGLKESANTEKSEKKSTAIKIYMHHLEAAVRNMSPSVSATERKKYQAIYERFINSRGGDFSQGATSGEKRATLA